jgi:hypothetical protein
VVLGHDAIERTDGGLDVLRPGGGVGDHGGDERDLPRAPNEWISTASPDDELCLDGALGSPVSLRPPHGASEPSPVASCAQLLPGDAREPPSLDKAASHARYEVRAATGACGDAAVRGERVTENSFLDCATDGGWGLPTTMRPQRWTIRWGVDAPFLTACQVGHI